MTRGIPFLYLGDTWHGLSSPPSPPPSPPGRYAFITSPYPVILSLEMHCGIPQQQKIAHYLKSILGPKLHVKPPRTSNSQTTAHLPSPNELKYKVLVKGRQLPFLGALEADDDSDDDDEEMDKVRARNKNASASGGAPAGTSGGERGSYAPKAGWPKAAGTHPEVAAAAAEAAEAAEAADAEASVMSDDASNGHHTTSIDRDTISTDRDNTSTDRDTISTDRDTIMTIQSVADSSPIDPMCVHSHKPRHSHSRARLQAAPRHPPGSLPPYRPWCHVAGTWTSACVARTLAARTRSRQLQSAG